MKIAYVAGPYRAGNGRTVRQNIRAAEDAAVAIWRAGWVAVCPHLNTAFFDGEVSDLSFLRGDLEIIRRLKPDAVILLPGWQQSHGSIGEARLAESLHIPCYELDEWKAKYASGERTNG